MRNKKRILRLALMVLELMFFGVTVAYAQNSEAMQYNTNGVNALNRRDYDKAIADFNMAIRIDPNYLMAYANRAAAYNGKGDYDKAIADYTQAIQLEPNNATAYNNRAAIYNGKGDYDKAIADANQAIRLNPNLSAAYANRAEAYHDKGDYDKAIADYTQAIQLNPNVIVAYNNRAAAYNDKGDYDKAIADANQAIRLDPNYANAYRHRGFAYMQKGNFSQAREDTNKALQLNPNSQKAKEQDAELRRRGYSEREEKEKQAVSESSIKLLFDLWNELNTNKTKDQVITKAREVLKVIGPVKESTEVSHLDVGDNYNNVENRFPKNLTSVSLVSTLPIIDAIPSLDGGRTLEPNVSIDFSDGKLFAIEFMWLKYTDGGGIGTTSVQLRTEIRREYGEPRVFTDTQFQFPYYIWETPEIIIFCMGRTMQIINKKMLK
jgi:tetratricopeptide (TPR) repeat protein